MTVIEQHPSDLGNRSSGCGKDSEERTCVLGLQTPYALRADRASVQGTASRAHYPLGKQ